MIGALPRDEAVAKLRELGEDAAADAIERAAPPPKTMRAASLWPFGDRAWQHTAHSIGFLPADGGAGPAENPRRRRGSRPILSLKNARINIALNVLRVADYPAAANIAVLFDFYAATRCPAPARTCTSTPPTGRARANMW